MIEERCWFSQINFFIEYFPHRINLHALRLLRFLSRLRLRRFCLESEIGPEFQYCNDLHDNKRDDQTGQISYSYESSPLLEISDRYEAAHILCINLPFRSVLLSSVMKYRPLSTVFKPALEHSLDNF